MQARLDSSVVVAGAHVSQPDPQGETPDHAAKDVSQRCDSVLGRIVENQLPKVVILAPAQICESLTDAVEPRLCMGKGEAQMLQSDMREETIDCAAEVFH